MPGFFMSAQKTGHIASSLVTLFRFRWPVVASTLVNQVQPTHVRMPVILNASADLE